MLLSILIILESLLYEKGGKVSYMVALIVLTRKRKPYIFEITLSVSLPLKRNQTDHKLVLQVDFVFSSKVYVYSQTKKQQQYLTM